MRSPAITKAALGACLVVFSGAAVQAQPASGDIAVGFSFLRDTEQDQSYPRGGFFTATRRLHGWVAVTAEVGISAATSDFSRSGGGIFDMRYESLQAGPRFSSRRAGPRPYIEVLAGATRWRIRERGNPVGWESAADFSIQPGAGLDLPFGRRAALRAGGDLRLLLRRDNRFDTPYRTKLYRLYAGVAFPLG